MLGGASTQPPVSDSGWDEDFFAPKVWWEISFDFQCGEGKSLFPIFLLKHTEYTDHFLTKA